MLRRSVFGSLAALFLPAIAGGSSPVGLVKPGSFKLVQGAALRSTTFDVDTAKIIRDTVAALKSTGFMMPDGTKLIPFDSNVDDSDWYNVCSSG